MIQQILGLSINLEKCFNINKKYIINEKTDKKVNKNVKNKVNEKIYFK